MLETIHEYAAERLEESGEAEQLRRRHAEHYLALAEEAEAHLYGPSAEDWLGRLEREHDNVRAALDRLEASGESTLALRLVGAVSDFWQIRGHLAEGGRRLERALQADEDPTAARVKALNGAAELAIARGDVAAGRARAEEALALSRELGDPRGIARSTWALGYVAVEEGDLAGAQRLLAESVREFRALGDEHSALGPTRTLAWTYQKLAIPAAGSGAARGQPASGVR
jgi:predicted ATPase